MKKQMSAAILRLHNSPEYNIRCLLISSLVGITAPLNPHTNWRLPLPMVALFTHISIDMHLKLIQQSYGD